MRMISVLMCILVTLFSFCGCQKNYTHAVDKVTITASQISNNSVGNNWEKSYTCNGKTISSGEQYTVPLDTTKTVTIEATITENDKHPDIGSCSLSVVLRDNFETSETITVTENKGRYKDNNAQWKITCNVKIIEKLEQK